MPSSTGRPGGLVVQHSYLDSKTACCLVDEMQPGQKISSAGELWEAERLEGGGPGVFARAVSALLCPRAEARPELAPLD